MLYFELCRLYHRFRLMHYRNLFSRIREKDGSLSATEAYSVDAIYLLGEPTIKSFSDFIGISQSNATYKINSLISKGYIERIPSADDRREFRLRITDKFFSYYDRDIPFIADATNRLREEYSDAELETFERMIRSLCESVKQGQ